MFKTLPFRISGYSLLLLMFSYLTGFAQEKPVSGQVLAPDGNPLVGVTVKVKGTSRGTTTDVNGRFQLAAAAGETLQFSFIGYAPQETKVDDQSTFRIVMQPTRSQLNEVVVTALGQQQQERTLGYAVQKISGADIENTHRTDFVSALQGRVAGLTVNSTSGLPGASDAIQLRGINSIGLSNSPLFIVDGVPVDNSTFSTASLTSINQSAVDYANRRFDFTNRIADLNPNDIESITILKGPEATALYGIDATSGAIVITTKSGRAGKPTVDYNGTLTTTRLYRFPEVQRVYDRGFNGVFDPSSVSYFGPRIPAGTQFYDNIHHFFRTGIRQTHNLSFSGGNNQITYRLSSSYLDDQGVVPNTDYKRINVALRVNARISSKLSTDASISYIQADNTKAEKGPTSFLLGLYLWPPYMDVRDYLNPDGSKKLVYPNHTPDQEYDNPFFSVNKNHFYDKTRRVIGNFGITYDPLRWLSISGRIGNDAYTTNGMIYYNANSTFAYQFKGRIDQYTSIVQNLYTQLLVKASHNFGQWNTSLLLGNAVYNNSNHTEAQSGQNFLVNDFVSLNIANPLTISNLTSLVRKRLIGVFGEFNIGYKQIFNLQLTGRNDWTSTLPIGRNHFFYPSANMSFAFTEISALSGLKQVMNFGKLRASVAQVGKDAPPYQVYPGLLPQTTTGGGFAFNFNGPNPYLRPEQTTSYSFGAHLEFYNSRLILDGEYYKTKSIHQIVPLVRKSYAPGFVLYTINGGSLTNHGLELTITGTPIQTSALRWDITFNYAFNRSKLLSLPSGVTEFYNSDTWLYGNLRNGMKVGGPLTTFTGATWMRNNNGDILINPLNGYPLKDNSFQVVGDRNPKYTGGVNNSFQWKGFTLSFLFDFRHGGDVFNATALQLYRLGLSTATLNRETPVVVKGVLKDGMENSSKPTPNTIEITPMYNSNYFSNVSVESDYVEKNINWIRLRDVYLMYEVPRKWLGRQHTIQSLSVSISSSNLFMITNYSGQDPDVNGTTPATLGSGGAGIDYNVVGKPRVFNFTVNARF